MPRYDIDEDFDEYDLRHSHGRSHLPHSGMGIASLVAAALAILVAGGVVVLAILVDDGQQPPADEEMLTVLGVVGFLTAAASGVVGFCLGLIGSVQAERNPVLAITGTIVNALTLLGLLVLMCIGMLMEM